MEPAKMPHVESEMSLPVATNLEGDTRDKELGMFEMVLIKGEPIDTEPESLDDQFDLAESLLGYELNSTSNVENSNCTDGRTQPEATEQLVVKVEPVDVKVELLRDAECDSAHLLGASPVSSAESRVCTAAPNGGGVLGANAMENVPAAKEVPKLTAEMLSEERYTFFHNSASPSGGNWQLGDAQGDTMKVHAATAHACDASFPSPNQLENCPSANPHFCHSCGKTFRHKANLAAHSVLHSDTCAFACEICRARFTRERYLRAHRRTHVSERPPEQGEAEKCVSDPSANTFQCPFCEKMYRHRRNLRIHLHLHTGDNSCVCPVCGKAFGSRSGLQIHSRTHSGEKPYVCEGCNKAFMHSRSLKSHLCKQGLF